MTRTTPVIVIARPNTIKRLKGSSNINQAIAAVVGGVKYRRLVTLVAAPFRIIINNKLMDPIESGITAQNNAAITDRFQTIFEDSKQYMTQKARNAEIPN